MNTMPPVSHPKWHRITSQADGLGESPFWNPAEKCLYWVDIPGQRLRRMAMTADAWCEQKLEDWPLGEEPGCFAPAAQGGWVMATRSGVYRALSWGGPRRFHESYAAAIWRKFGQVMPLVHGRVVEAIRIHRCTIGSAPIRLGAGSAIGPVFWLERKLGKQAFMAQ